MGATESSDLDAVREENDRAIQRLAAMGAQIGGIDTQYMILMLEQLLSPAVLADVQRRHTEWLAEQLAKAEGEIRRRMLGNGVAAGIAEKFPHG